MILLLRLLFFIIFVMWMVYLKMCCGRQVEILKITWKLLKMYFDLKTIPTQNVNLLFINIFFKHNPGMHFRRLPSLHIRVKFERWLHACRQVCYDRQNFVGKLIQWIISSLNCAFNTNRDSSVASYHPIQNPAIKIKLFVYIFHQF